MNTDPSFLAESGYVPEKGQLGAGSEEVTQEDLRRESRNHDWADAARFTHWVGVVLLGSTLVSLINATPLRLSDPAWQLNLISLLLSTGTFALLGALLICLGRLFNPNDLQIQKRASLVQIGRAHV